LRPIFFRAGRQGICRTIGRVGQHRSSLVIQASLTHTYLQYTDACSKSNTFKKYF
jgi:hypothetical protein